VLVRFACAADRRPRVREAGRDRGTSRNKLFVRRRASKGKEVSCGRTVAICGKCQQPIVSEESFGFVCFKIPGKEGYHFTTAGFPVKTAGKPT